MLIDKAKELHGELEVDVLIESVIGHTFYTRYGFECLDESFHEPTGQQMLRLKFTSNK